VLLVAIISIHIYKWSLKPTLPLSAAAYADRRPQYLSDQQSMMYGQWRLCPGVDLQRPSMALLWIKS